VLGMDDTLVEDVALMLMDGSKYLQYCDKQRVEFTDLGKAYFVEFTGH
jgi:hypothetical protein